MLDFVVKVLRLDVWLALRKGLLLSVEMAKMQRVMEKWTFALIAMGNHGSWVFILNWERKLRSPGSYGEFEEI